MTLARALGAGLLQPAPSTVAGLEPVAVPVSGTALVELDFGIDPASVAPAVPPAEANPVHGRAPALEVVLEQMDTFYRRGVIEHTRDGVCDPD